ncbi:Uma2 family endonuclease [Hymenobacter caeli]|uniref:Putative restriction endonuclease domain-containing protein n=1 Tax=Hymenobacter caeli TaxID=2735894 RepID=A0ABX2FR98_9BACT|nr:Uma2 family endonuclease [Hymenobacter caeli]NRT19014.1 hypothetical protein [Hymenobacter caeli]
MERSAAALSEYESERGKPGPSENHGAVQSNLIFELGTRYRSQYRFLSEIDLNVGGRVLVPDIGIFFPMVVDMAHDQLVVEQLPLTAIEIITVTQELRNLISRANQYLRAGVKSCWVVLPEVAGILVYSAPGEYKFFHGPQTLTDPATGIELPLGPLFE